MNAYHLYSSYKTKKFGASGITHAVRHIQTIGLGLLAVALGGISRPSITSIRLETGFLVSQLNDYVASVVHPQKPLPKSVPVVFTPLLDNSGNEIIPSDMNFSIIVPKIGINAAVIPAVDPTNPASYDEALQTGVAHASTSFFPNENGAVYLFSHSTNYEWFVKDLNAVFYLMKNLEAGDLVILIYKGTRYTYAITEQRIVAPDDISYLAPIEGKKMLILQTCWPPGSTTERLLVLADLIDISYNK
jgi:LPXTG-site transpeptidase (sortase) family protein